MANIIIVDDNVEFAENTAELLSLTRGDCVQLAKDGFEGLDLLSRFSPEVILVDYHMPRMNGFGYVQELRKIPGYLGVPCIGIGDFPEEERDCLQGFSPKGSGIEHLSREIDRVLSN